MRESRRGRGLLAFRGPAGHCVVLPFISSACDYPALVCPVPTALSLEMGAHRGEVAFEQSQFQLLGLTGQLGWAQEKPVRGPWWAGWSVGAVPCACAEAGSPITPLTTAAPTPVVCLLWVLAQRENSKARAVLLSSHTSRRPGFCVGGHSTALLSVSLAVRVLRTSYSSFSSSHREL